MAAFSFKQPFAGDGRVTGVGRFPPFGLTFPRRVPNGDLRPIAVTRRRWRGWQLHVAKQSFE